MSNKGFKLKNYETNKMFPEYLVFYFENTEELMEIITNSKNTKIKDLVINDNDILVYDKKLGILLANEGYKWTNIAINRNENATSKYVMYFRNTEKLEARISELHNT